jgi:rhodanese-related sulfurtransferase/rubrerythrin
MNIMKWRQFLTPVRSLSAAEAKSFMEKKTGDAFTLLDVRQPGEYKGRHIPGAKLIPLADIGTRIKELDADKPTIVYCAVGGRSRVASQMLAGRGFKDVYNLSGGIKAWESEAAFGPEDLGIDLFSGNESPEEILIAAYSLEQGLREFYLSMTGKAKNEKIDQLFEKLAAIEVKHQERIFDEYLEITGKTISRDEFSKDIVSPAMEGGLTTEEYLARYQPDVEVAAEVISLAMAIEAQSLDLYQRASERTASVKSREVLLEIANEERAHLRQLGRLMEVKENR